jgi:hypothetical protein
MAALSLGAAPVASTAAAADDERTRTGVDRAVGALRARDLISHLLPCRTRDLATKSPSVPLRTAKSV